MTRIVALLGRSPGRLALVLLLTLGAGLAEGVGLLLLVPLLAIVGIDVPVEGSVGAVASAVASAFEALGLPVSLAVVLAVYVAVVAAHSALRYLEQVSATALVEDLKADLREDLFAAVARADWIFHLRTRGSELLQVLNDEVFRAGDAATQALSLLTLGVTAAVYLGVAGWLSPLATAVAVATAALLLLVLRARTARSRAAGEAWSEASEGVYFTASEFLAGIKTAKSHADEARHTRAFARETRRLADAWVSSARSYADVQFFFTTGAAVVLSLLVWAALEVIQLETAALLVLIFIFLRVIPRFTGLQRGVQYLVNALPALDRVERVLADARASAETAPGTEAAGGGLVPPRAGGRFGLEEGVRVEGVHFAYPAGMEPESDGERRAPVVHDVSLEIPARTTVALVGASGGGKTTLADLLIGLLRPDRGRIVVDGTPLDRIDPRHWRAGIGYVPQESFLFDDTIRANLLPEEGTDEDTLLQALRAARLEAFVAGLPRGLDTVVGERGVRLSGGERQRLALARALVRRPSLLVLDEATSALDYENEALIREALVRQRGERTVVLITHRLSLARDADRIFVLDGGRLVQSGSWDELMAADGRFRELAASAGPTR